MSRPSLTSMMEKHRTGAATLLMSMLANAATNMLAIRTTFGDVPALLNTNVAMRLSILHFDRAAARVNPPRRSIITGLHIDEKTNDAASFAERRLKPPLSSLSFTTRRTTQRKGITREVANRGIVYTQSVSHDLVKD